LKNEKFLSLQERETAMNENDLLLKEKLKKDENEYSSDDNDSADDWPDKGEPAGLPREKTMGPAVPKKDSKILFFTGSKGGCGCSFISNAVAAYYAKNKNKNVLLADLNCGKKDSRLIFNLSLKSNLRDIGDIEFDFKEIDFNVLKRLVVSLEDSLHLVLPPLKFEKASLVTGKNLNLLLDSLSGLFDLVIVDTPFYLLQDQSMDFLEYTDMFVLITQADLISINNLEVIISNLCLENMPARFEIVINKFNSRPVISSPRIISMIKSPVSIFIPYDRDIELLYLTRGPAPMFDYNLRITRAISDFAESLFEKLF
jgi:Flp pilus assembly CpaE family ATPase